MFMNFNRNASYSNLQLTQTSFKFIPILGTKLQVRFTSFNFYNLPVLPSHLNLHYTHRDFELEIWNVKLFLLL